MSNIPPCKTCGAQGVCACPDPDSYAWRRYGAGLRAEEALLADAQAEDALYASAAAHDAQRANEGRTPSHCVYHVVIDNGTSYSGNLADYSPSGSAYYDTEDAALEAGRDWLEQFYADNDIDPEDREHCGAGFDVIEVPVYDAEEFQDDEMELLHKAALNRGQP